MDRVWDLLLLLLVSILSTRFHVDRTVGLVDTSRMYAKHFASMYEGSMIGRGSAFFAVWGYVISHMKPDKVVGSWVELNPKLIGLLIGEREDVVTRVIGEMCEPDAESRSREEEGRKLVQLGQYAYRVVNGAKYRSIMSEEDRREYKKLKQREYRKRNKVNPVVPGEDGQVKAVKEGWMKPEELGYQEEKDETL